MTQVCTMTIKIDIAEAAHKLAALHQASAIGDGHRKHESLAVVVPLAEGRCDVVREFLDEGPPFDPAAIGLEKHAVYLTEREAIFVFETEQGVEALERILAEPEVWDVVGAWERCACEEPRVATAIFDWRRSSRRCGSRLSGPGGWARPWPLALPQPVTR